MSEKAQHDHPDPCLHFDANQDGFRLCLIGRGQPPYGCGQRGETGVVITCACHQSTPQDPHSDHSAMWRAMWHPARSA